MKKLFFIFQIFLGFLLTQNAQISYKVKLETSSLKFDSELARDGETYQKIILDNLTYTEQSGVPNLPVKFIKLIIPTEQDVEQINVSFVVSNKRTLSNKIYPAQPDIPTSINVKELDFVKPDPKIYDSEKPWPNKIVEVVHSGYLDNNNHIVTLKVVPFQYYPKLNQLDELDNIQIDLNLKSNSKEIVLPKVRTFVTQEIWDNVLKFTVDNKDDILKYQRKTNVSE